uniref:Uncharacterized protein n=1 Tax=Setaria italica TaxID=4555 RepID=K4AMP1_SETIT
MSIRIRTHRVAHLRGWKPNSDLIRVGLAIWLATLPPCTCGYLGGVAPAALGRAADEPPTSHDEPTTSRGTGGDLAVHVDELLRSRWT